MVDCRELCAVKKETLKKVLVGKFSWRRLLRSTAVIFLVVIVFTLSCADQIIFQPPAAGYTDDADVIKLTTADGKMISAMYFEKEGAEFTILFSHGNAEDMGPNREFFRLLNRWGFSVFAYDYHGYGTSEGRPSEKNVYLDIDAAWRYLVDDLATEPNRIIALGRSVGSGPAVYLATRTKPAGLVLESPLTSAFRVVTRIGILPFDKFDNIARIAHVHCPVLVIAGEADNVVGIRHGKALYEKANEPKQHLWVPGAGHNDLVWVAGDRYRRALDEFVRLIRRQTNN